MALRPPAEGARHEITQVPWAAAAGCDDPAEWDEGVLASAQQTLVWSLKLNSEQDRRFFKEVGAAACCIRLHPARFERLNPYHADIQCRSRELQDYLYGIASLDGLLTMELHVKLRKNSCTQVFQQLIRWPLGAWRDSTRCSGCLFKQACQACLDDVPT